MWIFVFTPILEEVSHPQTVLSSQVSQIKVCRHSEKTLLTITTDTKSIENFYSKRAERQGFYYISSLLDHGGNFTISSSREDRRFENVTGQVFMVYFEVTKNETRLFVFDNLNNGTYYNLYPDECITIQSNENWVPFETTQPAQ